MRRLLLALCLLLLGVAAGAQDTFRTYPSTGGITGLTSSGTVITSTLPINVVNGTTTQYVEVYSTYTDASNYIKTVVGRSAYFGAGQGITVEGLGTGANPNFLIGTRGTGYVDFSPNGSSAFRLDSASGLYTNAIWFGLTASTMTANTVPTFSTYTMSWNWTNAQVAALGAVTAGDIGVVTIPAKTQIVDALLVITGQGVQAAGTYTVSCGDAIAGTPFTNLIAVADAKAAANTVYGDQVAERGSSVDTEWYYTPSYTATTLLTCHFITVGANLSTVTGSTGKLILTVRKLP